MNRTTRPSQRIGCYLPTTVGVTQQLTTLGTIQIRRKDRPAFVRIVHCHLMNIVSAVRDRQRLLTPNAILKMQHHWPEMIATCIVIVDTIETASPPFVGAWHAQTLQSAQTSRHLMGQINPIPASTSKTVDILRRLRTAAVTVANCPGGAIGEGSDIAQKANRIKIGKKRPRLSIIAGRHHESTAASVTPANRPTIVWACEVKGGEDHLIECLVALPSLTIKPQQTAFRHAPAMCAIKGFQIGDRILLLLLRIGTDPFEQRRIGQPTTRLLRL